MVCSLPSAVLWGRYLILMRLLTAIALTLFALAPLGCRSCKAPQVSRAKDAGTKREAAATSKKPGSDSSLPPLTELPSRMNATHLLVSYGGAFRAPAWIQRDREGAKREADQLMERVIKGPEKLSELARRYSDAPRAMEGGYLGNWYRGKMVRAFEAAVARMEPGAVGGPVETSFGFHIIRREHLLAEEQISGSHLIIAYKGALRAPEKVTRTRREASTLADELLSRLSKEPQNYTSLQLRYSDGPRATRGGGLGLWISGLGQRPPVIDRELLILSPGVISNKIIETPFGFHLLKRLEVSRPKLLSGAHILITYKGAKNNPSMVARSRARAKVLARRLYKELKESPDDFADLAQEHSDDVSAGAGGVLGRWPRGQYHPTFEKVLQKLKPNRISRPVETPFGFHIIKRMPMK